MHYGEDQVDSIGDMDERGVCRDFPGGPDAERPATPRRRTDRRRGDWLEIKLKAIHDEVVHEPLPDTLRRLIDAIDR